MNPFKLFKLRTQNSKLFKLFKPFKLSKLETRNSELKTFQTSNPERETRNVYSSPLTPTSRSYRSPQPR